MKKAIEDFLISLIESDDAAEFLGEAIAENVGCEAADEITLAGNPTFEEAGVLTTNRGIVLRLSDGSEHQITIA